MNATAVHFNNRFFLKFTKPVPSLFSWYGTDEIEDLFMPFLTTQFSLSTSSNF